MMQRGSEFSTFNIAFLLLTRIESHEFFGSFCCSFFTFRTIPSSPLPNIPPNILRLRSSWGQNHNHPPLPQRIVPVLKMSAASGSTSPCLLPIGPIFRYLVIFACGCVAASIDHEMFFHLQAEVGNNTNDLVHNNKGFSRFRALSVQCSKLFHVTANSMRKYRSNR